MGDLVRVAAEIIVNEKSILIAKRCDAKHLGKWELPRGKIKRNEAKFLRRTDRETRYKKR